MKMYVLVCFGMGFSMFLCVMLIDYSLLSYSFHIYHALFIID